MGSTADFAGLLISLLVIAIAVARLNTRGYDQSLRQARIEHKLDRLMDQVGAPGTSHGADEDVRALLLVGQRIEAIKRYRQLHSVGLRQAKAAVDAMRRGEPLP